MVLKREQFNLERIKTRNFVSKEWFTFIISILLIIDLAILLNIPVLRQILGFLFLTFLPGLLILHILKLNKLGFVEKFILTWGVSISFLMFFGLLLNNLSLSLGYDTPLSTISLLISFNLAFIILGVIGCKTNKEPMFSLPNLNLSTAEKAFLIVPIFFPALSIFGTHVMNTTDNNFILMFMLFLIPIYVAFVCFFNHKFPKRLYPVVIFLISISLLLLLALRSNYLIGADVHSEYSFFRTTLDNLHLSITGYSPFDACLAISLLPTIYKSILNISPLFLYKILSSLLCSVFPVIIYLISKKYVEEGYAFLASMYFMSNAAFLWTEYNARANIAMLFFAFAMMTLFNDRIEPLKKRILFIMFMVSCTMSHYSNTYIFFFVLVGTFVGMETLSKKYTFKKDISLTLVILFFAVIFFWYSQVTEAAFNDGVRFIENTLSNLNRFFIEELRSEQVQTLLGKGDVLQESIIYRIHWLLTWITFAFIGIGIITLLRRYKEVSFPELNFKKPDFLKEKFEVVYFVITLVISGLLVSILVLPYVSEGYGLGRSYPLASTILSVFFVIGGIILSKHFFFLQKTLLLSKSLYGKFASQKTCAKRKNKGFFGKLFFSKKRFDGKNASEVRAYLIILLILIPYFLCVTGVMYNVFGVPRAITLNSDGEEYDMMYILDQESYAAKWLGKNMEQNKPRIYTDYYGAIRLISQGKITLNIDQWSLVEHKKKKINGYIYLRYCNVVDEKLMGVSGMEYNMTEYSDMFDGKNRIYDNGGSEVHK